MSTETAARPAWLEGKNFGRTAIACPECGAMKSLVIDSRSTEEGIRRRRLCANGHRYSTVETVIT